MQHEDVDLKQELRQLSTETTHLVKQEIELLKAELNQKTDTLKDELRDATAEFKHATEVARNEVAEAGKKAGIGAGLFGGASLLGLGAFGALTAAIIAGIAEFLPVWAGALITAVVYGAIAGGLAMAGKTKVSQAAEPLSHTTDRFKNVVTSGTEAVRNQVSPVPQRTLDSLKDVKQDVGQSWKSGGRQGR